MLLDIHTMAPLHRQVELVERKGIGHPDTLSDGLAEQVSVRLGRYYLEHFGAVLHHNVDKVSISAGRSKPAFGGGEVLEPIEVTLGGWATFDVHGELVPVEELAQEAARTWLKACLPRLDIDRHVRIHCHIRPASPELTGLFGSAKDTVPLANDSSIGVGFAPLSKLEHTVLEIERRLNSKEYLAIHPEAGTDVKILGQRRGQDVLLTIARAFVGRNLTGMPDYLEAKLHLMAFAQGTAHELGVPLSCLVNTGDQPNAGSVYLTVTGSSVEAGDDGQVGRGNRVNGLITPHRPMSLEAIAGKNPVSHTGKLYNVLATQLAHRIVARIPSVLGATCILVSQVGRPLDDPSLVEVSLESDEGKVGEEHQGPIRDLVSAELSGLGELTRRFVRGEVQLF